MAKQKRRGRLRLGDDGDTDALFYALIEASAGVIREDGDVTEDEEDGDDAPNTDATTDAAAATDDRRVAYKAEAASSRSRPERPTTPMRKGKYHQVRDTIPDDTDNDGGGNAANDDDDDAKAAPPAAQDESLESASLVRVRELLGEDW